MNICVCVVSVRVVLVSAVVCGVFCVMFVLFVCACV